MGWRRGAAVGISEGDGSVKAQTQSKCVDTHIVQSGWSIGRAGGKNNEMRDWRGG